MTQWKFNNNSIERMRSFESHRKGKGKEQCVQWSPFPILNISRKKRGADRFVSWICKGVYPCVIAQLSFELSRFVNHHGHETSLLGKIRPPPPSSSFLHSSSSKLHSLLFPSHSIYFFYSLERKQRRKRKIEGNNVFWCFGNNWPNRKTKREFVRDLILWN